MPWAARKPCSHVGCGALVNTSDRYCQAHQRKTWRDEAKARRANPERRALDAQYRGQAWRKYAKSYLAQHPLCVACKAEGRIGAASLVDHIVPTAQGGSFWAGTNHQAMCDHHHRVKSAREVFHGANG
jgi:5-methylcytosine-specific restriction protein A